MRKYSFPEKCNFHEIGIDSLRRRVFVYLGSDLYGTHSEQRGQCLAGLHFLHSRINPEQCYNELNRIWLHKPTRKPFPVTLTFSSVIGARAPITNHHRRSERDIHSILAVAWRLTPSIHVFRVHCPYVERQKIF